MRKRWIADECPLEWCEWGGNAGRTYGSRRAAEIAEAVHMSWHRRRGDVTEKSTLQFVLKALTPLGRVRAKRVLLAAAEFLELR